MLNRIHGVASKHVDYVGREISCCKQWLLYESFARDMGQTYFTGAQLHRKNPDGNYETANCQWLSKSDHMKVHRRLMEEKKGRAYGSSKNTR